MLFMKICFVCYGGFVYFCLSQKCRKSWRCYVSLTEEADNGLYCLLEHFI